MTLTILVVVGIVVVLCLGVAAQKIEELEEKVEDLESKIDNQDAEGLEDDDFDGEDEIEEEIGADSVSVSVDDLLVSVEVAGRVVSEGGGVNGVQIAKDLERVRRVLRKLDPDEVKALLE